MSSFDTALDVERQIRAAMTLATGPEAFDEAVRGFRAARPKAVTEQRKQPRLSIAELNELDADQIADRIRSTGFDNRGPVIKFLDMLDAPRNFIAGRIVSPALRRRKEAAGERGAFGEGKVLFSDLLGEMGMRPGVARGVLGFVGDVALDPLTYVGGAPAAAKIVGKTGQVVKLGRQGARSARRAVKDVQAGRSISDPLVADIYRTVTPTGDAAKDAESLSKAIFGEQAPRGTGLRKVRSIALEKIAGTEGAGGVADALRAGDDAYTKAARAFVARYGQGAPIELLERAGKVVAPRGVSIGPKGINVGNAQSQILHIPFTEIGLNVPGFTVSARAALATRAAAMIRAGSSVPGVWLADAGRRAEQVAQLADDAREAADRAIDYRGFVEDDVAQEAAAYADEARAAARQARIDYIAHLQAAPPDAIPFMSFSELAALQRQRAAADAAVEVADAEARSNPFYDIVASDLAEKERATLDKGRVFDPAKFRQVRDSILKNTDAAARGEVLEELGAIDRRIDDLRAQATEATPPPAPKPPQGKQPWEMTKEEWSAHEYKPLAGGENLPETKRAVDILRANGIEVQEVQVRGSRAAGVATPTSDFDIYIRVPESDFHRADDLMAPLSKDGIDVLLNWKGVGKLGGTLRGEKTHRRLVERAISEGKITGHPDYPDLKPPQAAGAGTAGGGGAIDVPGERIRTRIEKWIERATREDALKTHIEDLEDSNANPQSILDKFFKETYPVLTDRARGTYENLIERHIGLKPGDVLWTDRAGNSHIAASWEEIVRESIVPKNMDILNFGEKGLVASADILNQSPGLQLRTVEGPAQLPAGAATAATPPPAPKPPQAAGEAVGGEAAKEVADAVAALEAQKESILAAKRAELMARVSKGAYGEILKMSDTDIERAANFAESAYDTFTAKQRFANAVGGTMAQQMTNPERIVADAAKMFLGLGPDDIGHAVMTAPRAMIEKAMGVSPEHGLGITVFNTFEDYSRGLRSVFGNRRARINESRRLHDNLVRYGGGREAATVLRERFLPETQRIVRTYGLHSNDQKDQMFAVANALLYERRMKQAGHRFADEWWIDPSGAKVEPPLKTTLREIKDGGGSIRGLDKAKYGALVNDLTAMVDEAGSLLDELAPPGAVREGYVPVMATPQAAGLIGRARATGYGLKDTGKAGAAATGGRPLQAFEKTRDTDFYQWTDADGNAHQLYEFQFGLADHYRPPGALKASSLPEEAQREVAKVIEEVDRFRTAHPGLSDDMRPILLGKNADPYMLNKIAPLYFRALTLGNPLGQLPSFPIFSDNLLHVLSESLSGHAIAKARENFREMLGMGIPLHQEIVLGGTGGSTRPAIGGAIGKSFEVAGSGVRGTILGNNTVRIGDLTYRPLKNLDPAKLYEPGLTQGLMAEQQLTQLYPTPVAEMLERFLSLSGEEATGAASRLADQLVGIWRSTTLFHPSWTVFNIVGDVILWAQGRVPIGARTPEFFNHAVRAMMSTKGLAADRDIVLNGQRRSLLALIEEYRRTSGGVKAEEVLQQTGIGTRYEPSVGGETLGRRGREFIPRVRREFDRAYDLRAAQYAAGVAKSKIDRLKISARAIGDERVLRNFLRPWFAANGAAQDSMRFAAFLSLLDAGESVATAGAKVRETFFDFADMTDAERWTRRWVLPFFAWLRNNGAYQMRTFLQDPKWAAAVPKLKEAIEEAVAGEEQIPDHLRPRWMREQLAIQLGEDPDSRYALNIGTAINTEPVNVAGGAVAGGPEGLLNLIRYLTGGMNPVLSVPLQLGAQTEFFTGRRIGPTEGEGDLSAREFVSSQVRQFREFGIGSSRSPLGVAFGSGVGAGVARATLGGRAQPLSDERIAFQRGREFRERQDDIRRSIVLAERNGDQEGSLRGRVKLMALYRWAEQNGLEELVPKWAGKQLGELTAAR